MNIKASSATEPAENSAGDAFDLIVVGAGVGGLTAALVGALTGQRTLVLEKSATVGGTSARSSGTVWIPGNAYQARAGVDGDATVALGYLDALVGERAPRGMREAFIAAGPEMLDFLQSRTDLAFQPYPFAPDYRQELPGAAEGLRPLEPLPFDGRALGRHFHEVGWPLPELMLFGKMMITRGEAARLLGLGRSARETVQGMALGARLVTRYALDRLRHRRGTRLVLGNALVARLYKNLLDRRVPVWLGSAPTELLRSGGRVSGVRAMRNGIPIELQARNGVVLAGGGFPANPQMRERYLPSPVPQYTAAFEGCTGDTLQIALEAGAALGPSGEDNALWFPSSVFQRKDGSTAVYPHIVLDRAKPGLIAVNAAGKRFVNEGVSYHDFTRAMFRAHGETTCIPAWLICDRRFVWNYGLGAILPRTLRLKPHLKRGYLHSAATLAALAEKIGVEPAGLAGTVRRHNEYARGGVDAEFGKGSGVYDRGNGDPNHRPNPCLGPIETPPFCAMAVYPTPLGTSLGLQTDEAARVLDKEGAPMAGLYACGNDQHSAFGGQYPGAGAQLGLAMVFGYLAAKDAAMHAAGG
ncbi:MAG: FAD-binding protein [SAR324 cluster bacterium]|nr:FAD-binding protein [SAR324 cluster bacterium]